MSLENCRSEGRGNKKARVSLGTLGGRQASMDQSPIMNAGELKNANARLRYGEPHKNGWWKARQEIAQVVKTGGVISAIISNRESSSHAQP
jgi:hypothetical protein